MQIKYFEHLKTGEELSQKTKLTLTELKTNSFTSTQVKNQCETQGLCPYEIAILLSKDAHVIVTDYNYLFNPGVASAFDVMSIPTLVVFDQTGREIDREVGLPAKRRLNQLAKGADSAANSLNGKNAR